MAESTITASILIDLRKKELAARQPNRIMEDGLFRLLPWLDKHTISAIAPAYGMIADALMVKNGETPNDVDEIREGIVTDLCRRVQELEDAAKVDTENKSATRTLPKLPHTR